MFKFIRTKFNYSFIDLYDREEYIELINEKFKDDINLPKKYHYSFCKWNSQKLNKIVKMKQYILKKTGLFPKKYDEEYITHFCEIISIKSKLPKDIMNLIAGHLFQ